MFGAADVARRAKATPASWDPEAEVRRGLTRVPASSSPQSLRKASPPDPRRRRQGLTEETLTLLQAVQVTSLLSGRHTRMPC